MAERKFRGVSESQEIERSARIPDTRTLWRRFSGTWQTTDGVILFHVGAIALAAATYSIPLSGELIVLLVLLFWYSQVKKDRPWNFPYRAPLCGNVSDGSYPSSIDSKTGKIKYKKGDGITFLGKEFGSNLEIWASNSDMRTHNLVLGTTGSGKTELLLGMVFNALVQNSGVVYVDGKGDVALYDNVFRLARLLGREDDLLVLNFITGGRDLAGKSTDRVTNTINPYARSSSSMQNELNISLMDDGGTGGDMWKGRAIAFISALSRPLCWLRDHGYLLLDPGAYISFFELPQIEKLVWDKKFTGIGNEEFTVKNPDFDESLKPLEVYLGTLPGYTVAKKGKQDQKTLEQHGFITMQLTRTFGDLTFTYGHIFRHKLGEIDFNDVVLNRRILIVLLPALERSPDNLRSLGKLVVGNLKAMMGSSLGSSLEGFRRQIIEARPTLAPVPFCDILDEYGYYAVIGFAVAPAQARSLAHSITFAAQDFSSLQKASKEEADATWENTNIRMVGRITSGEETETWKRIRGLAGEVDVEIMGGKEFRAGDIYDTYRTERNTRTERVARISYDDLSMQSDGEFHFFIGKKSDAGKRGGVRVIRGRSFYTGQDRDKYHTEIRINHFLKVEPPAQVDSLDREALAKIVAEKISSGAVANQFGGSGVEGVMGGVATTLIGKLMQHPALSNLTSLERAMASLAALSLRSRVQSDSKSGADLTIQSSAHVEPVAEWPPANSSQPDATQSDLPRPPSEGVEGGLGVAKAPPSVDTEKETSVPQEISGGEAPDQVVPMTEQSQIDTEQVAVIDDDPISLLLEGFQTTFIGDKEEIRQAVASVESHIQYEADVIPDELDDDGENFDAMPESIASNVVEAIVEGNRYAQMPIPEKIEEASFDDLLRKIVSN